MHPRRRRPSPPRPLPLARPFYLLPRPKPSKALRLLFHASFRRGRFLTSAHMSTGCERLPPPASSLSFRLPDSPYSFSNGLNPISGLLSFTRCSEVNNCRANESYLRRADPTPCELPSDDRLSLVEAHAGFLSLIPLEGPPQVVLSGMSCLKR